MNIDADLIQKGGVVGQGDDSLVPLQNGCICCTLKMDLVQQIEELLKMSRFDYIVIEASGICEPMPIAQTICSIPMMGPEFCQYGEAHLDSIVSVVDAMRLRRRDGSMCCPAPCWMVVSCSLTVLFIMIFLLLPRHGIVALGVTA